MKLSSSIFIIIFLYLSSPAMAIEPMLSDDVFLPTSKEISEIPLKMYTDSIGIDSAQQSIELNTDYQLIYLNMIVRQNIRIIDLLEKIADPEGYKEKYAIAVKKLEIDRLEEIASQELIFKNAKTRLTDFNNSEGRAIGAIDRLTDIYNKLNATSREDFHTAIEKTKACNFASEPSEIVKKGQFGELSVRDYEDFLRWCPSKPCKDYCQVFRSFDDIKIITD